MISGRESVLARRMWFVPDVVVWGRPGLGEIEFLAFEKSGSSGSVFLGTTGIGDSAQEIRFDQLTDHRGNYLPATISSPRVIPRSKDGTAVFVVGQETPTAFKIGHDPDVSTTVTSDLLIVEMGD